MLKILYGKVNVVRTKNLPIGQWSNSTNSVLFKKHLITLLISITFTYVIGHVNCLIDISEFDFAVTISGFHYQSMISNIVFLLNNISQHCIVLQVAEPTGGGEAVVAAYEDLKTKISEAATGGGGASPSATPTEETAASF